jgi:hypothetical protein
MCKSAPIAAISRSEKAVRRRVSETKRLAARLSQPQGRPALSLQSWSHPLTVTGSAGVPCRRLITPEGITYIG